MVQSHRRGRDRTPYGVPFRSERCGALFRVHTVAFKRFLRFVTRALFERKALRLYSLISPGGSGGGNESGGEDFFAEFFGHFGILGEELTYFFTALAQMRFAIFEP